MSFDLEMTNYLPVILCGCDNAKIMIMLFVYKPKVTELLKHQNQFTTKVS